MQTINYEGLFIENQSSSLRLEKLVFEAPLQININNKAYTVVMRTTDNDKDLFLC